MKIFTLKRSLGFAALAVSSLALALPAAKLHVKAGPVSHTKLSQVSHLPASRPAVLDHGNVLKYEGKHISIVALSGPPSDMLSFRIDGKRNPTLELPAGAEVTITFVNMDDDMMHNLRIANGVVDVKGTVGPKLGQGTSDLRPHSKTEASTQKLTVSGFTAGETLTYLCTIRGHAAGGMYGHIKVVRGG